MRKHVVALIVSFAALSRALGVCTCSGCDGVEPGSCCENCLPPEGFPAVPISIVHDGLVTTFSGAVDKSIITSCSLSLFVGKTDTETRALIANCTFGEDGGYTVVWNGNERAGRGLGVAEWGVTYVWELRGEYRCPCGCVFEDLSVQGRFTIGDPTAYEWTGFGADGVWTDPNNWTSDETNRQIRGFPGVGATAVFSESPSVPVRLPSGVAGAVRFEGASTHVVLTADDAAAGAAVLEGLESSDASGSVFFSNVCVRVEGPIRIGGDAVLVFAQDSEVFVAPEVSFDFGHLIPGGSLSFEGTNPRLSVGGILGGFGGDAPREIAFSVPLGGYGVPPLRFTGESSADPIGVPSHLPIRVRSASPAALVEARCETVLAMAADGFGASTFDFDAEGSVPYPATDRLFLPGGANGTTVGLVLEGHSPEPVAPVLTNFVWTAVSVSSATLRGTYRAGGFSQGTVHLYLIPATGSVEECESRYLAHWMLPLEAGIPLSDHSMEIASPKMEPGTDYKLVLLASNLARLSSSCVLEFTTAGGAAEAMVTGGNAETLSYGPYSIFRFSAGAVGTLSVTKGGPADFLVVGGGGAGGAGSGLPDALPGAGGAAGSVLVRSVETLLPGDYSVVVGAGGTGSNPIMQKGGMGGPSSIQNEAIGFSFEAAGGEGGGGSGAHCPAVSAGTASSIAGRSLLYGVSGTDGNTETPMGPAGDSGSGNGGSGGTLTGGAGGSGTVIVRMRTVPVTDSPIIAFRDVSAGIADATVSFELFEFGVHATASALTLVFRDADSEPEFEASLGRWSSLGISSVVVPGLKPGTSYQARLVASNPETGAAWSTDSFSFSTRAESRPQKDGTLSVQGLRFDGASLVSAVEVDSIRAGTLFLCYGSSYGGSSVDDWGTVSLGDYRSGTTLLGDRFDAFPASANYVRFVAVPADPLASPIWSETFARYEISASDGTPEVILNDAAPHPDRATSARLVHTVLSAGEEGGACDLYAVFGLSSDALSLTNRIAAGCESGLDVSALDGLVPGRTYFVRLFAEADGVRSAPTAIRSFTTAFAPDEDWDPAGRAAFGSPLLGGAVSADGLGAGDSATVHGLLRETGTAPCTITVETSFAGDFSDVVSRPVPAPGADGALSAVLHADDPSDPEWIEPGHPYAFRFRATDASGAFDLSPVGHFKAAAEARVAEPVVATPTHRRVVFEGTLAEFGAGSTTMLSLLVGSDSNALETIASRVLSEAGPFAFTNEFPNVCSTYFYAVIASNQLDSGLRSWRVSTATNAVVTTDETTYVWKASVPSGAWDSAANWENDRAGDCFGFPQSAEATAIFPEGVTASVSVTKSRPLRGLSFEEGSSVSLSGPATLRAPLSVAPSTRIHLADGLVLESTDAVSLSGAHSFLLGDSMLRASLSFQEDPDGGEIGWMFHVPGTGYSAAPLQPSPSDSAAAVFGEGADAVRVEVDPRSPVFFTSHVTFDVPLIDWPSGIATNGIELGELPPRSSFRWRGSVGATGLPTQLILRAYGNPATILQIR